MPTEVIMPQMGESITEGTIAKWLKQPGDAVRKDEPLFEISTDKVDAEIPAPIDGTLLEIRAQVGETLPINAVVALIGSSAEAAQPNAPAPSPQASAAPASAPAAPSAAPAGAAEPSQPEDRRLRSSPLVRRMAREHQLDLGQIPGTGSEGRITKQDILNYLTRSNAPATVPHGAPKAQVAAQPQLASPQGIEPMSRMRAIIAERMVASVREIPHVYSVYKIDMTRITRLRERVKGDFERRNGLRLTFMPFLAAAVVQALVKFPILNATVEGQSIRHRRHVNLGIAVALDWGLIVPVVKNAEEMSFLGLARSITGLAERARSKRLKPDEAQGSTFTLTNSGVWGGEFGTPIINQPDSAILGIGGLRKEPAVLTGADGNDSIAIRSMQQFCLGFDHRLIDGADAGKFLSHFQQTLENWDQPVG